LKKKSQRSRFCIGLYGLALLGVLSLAVAPVRAMAVQQTPEAPAQPTIESPANEATHPPKTEAAKTEEHENDEYRHAPVVQSLARMLHMDVETAARTFEIRSWRASIRRL
jgi:hypothetical protein